MAVAVLAGGVVHWAVGAGLVTLGAAVATAAAVGVLRRRTRNREVAVAAARLEDRLPAPPTDADYAVVREQLESLSDLYGIAASQEQIDRLDAANWG